MDFKHRHARSLETAMHSPEQIKEIRAEIIEHLERARALADQTGDFAAGIFIDTARSRLSGQPVVTVHSVRLGGRRRQLAS
jgi:hypothetical protein